VASRLEELTRSLDTRMVVSKELIDATRSSTQPLNQQWNEHFNSAGKKTLRGRANETEVWTYNSSVTDNAFPTPEKSDS